MTKLELIQKIESIRKSAMEQLRDTIEMLEQRVYDEIEELEPDLEELNIFHEDVSDEIFGDLKAINDDPEQRDWIKEGDRSLELQMLHEILNGAPE